MARRAAGAIDEVAALTRYGDEVFATAQNGGRHSGFLANYSGRSAREITRAQRSLGGRIAEHQGFLANPASHVDNWGQLKLGPPAAINQSLDDGDQSGIRAN